MLHQCVLNSSISHRLLPLLDSMDNTLLQSQACIHSLKFLQLGLAHLNKHVEPTVDKGAPQQCQLSCSLQQWLIHFWGLCSLKCHRTGEKGWLAPFRAWYTQHVSVLLDDPSNVVCRVCIACPLTPARFDQSSTLCGCLPPGLAWAPVASAVAA